MIDLWKNDIKAAKELYYSDYVIEKLKQESDPIKRSRILATARQELEKKAEEDKRLAAAARLEMEKKAVEHERTAVIARRKLTRRVLAHG